MQWVAGLRGSDSGYAVSMNRRSVSQTPSMALVLGSEICFSLTGGNGRQQQATVPGSLGMAGPVLQSALNDHNSANNEKPPSPPKLPVDASPNTLFRQDLATTNDDDDLL